MKNITFSKQDSRIKSSKAQPKPKEMKTSTGSKDESQEILFDLKNEEIMTFQDIDKEEKELQAFMSDNFSVLSEIQHIDPSVMTKQSRTSWPRPRNMRI